MPPPPSLIKWQTVFFNTLKSPDETLSPNFLLYKIDYRMRMEKTLKDHYPSLPVLIGEETWLKWIVYPFIEECFSSNWDIKLWVKRLPEWLSQINTNDLPEILIPLANLEKLHIDTFFSLSLSVPSASKLTSIRFAHQPHLHFFSSNYPLLSYRYKILNRLPIEFFAKGKEEWIALSLNQAGDVILNPIEVEEKRFLMLLMGVP